MAERSKTRTIQLNYLARVEGEGALYVKTRGNDVLDVRLKIFEPPRFFEAFLRGRKCEEALDITSRICGICPIAYIMTSTHAIESAFGTRVNHPIRELRRLAYCGEWIESHSLHIYMLHAPDFLSHENVIQMARDLPHQVQQGLKLKKIGNEIISFLGGREIHPVSFRLGGFYRVPTRSELSTLCDRLKWAKEAAAETVRWVSSFDFPDIEQDYEFVSLSHPDEYPMNEGKIVSNKGLNISPSEYDQFFEEEHMSYSTALQSRRRNQPKDSGIYFVGPLARMNLCFEQLSSETKQLAGEVGFAPVCMNPYKSIIARSLEVFYAANEALRIIQEYQMPDRPFAEVIEKESVGFACTEAPRGLLYNRFQSDSDGLIQDVKIVPPTSQNQRMIESDLRKLLVTKLNLSLNLPKKELSLECERMIRNYDPCISCAAHFLKLKMEEV